MGLFSKIFCGFKRTFDDEFYEDLEFILVSSDIGMSATTQIIDACKADAKSKKIKTEDDFKALLKEKMIEVLNIESEKITFPTLITFVGVNGVGKTTAIGRIANYYKKQGKKVLLVAGDTFRAAASEQLNEWSKRSDVRIVKYAEGADPGAVVFDGIASAVAKHEDVVLVDTAGRLHNKSNLMDELGKINRIIDKEWSSKGFQHLNYLVIDATTGQNALSQLESFNEAVHIDGIVLTKMDGTAKGGVVLAIAKEFSVPVKFIGVGESKEDILEFDAKDFVDRIL